MLARKLLPLFLCLVPFAVQATPTYSVTAVAPGRSTPTAINDLGDVVGKVGDPGSATYYGFVAGGGFFQLGFPGGVTVVNAINDSGGVAGRAVGEGAGSHGVAFMDSPGGSIQTFNPFNGYNSGASGINNAGQVVGTGDDLKNNHPFLMSNGTVTDLGSLGGTWGHAYAINNKGEVAGVSEITGDVSQHAFLYTNGAMTDLGTLGGGNGWSWATGINDNSQVVGYASYLVPGAAHQHAFLYSNGVMNDLGTLGGADSQAAGINNLGQVVGHSQGSFYGNHGFLFSDGAMLDLNALIDPALGWNIVDAVDINNNGQIAAYGLKDGVGYALRLDLAAPVPEPASAAMMLGGLGLLGCGARRRRGAHAQTSGTESMRRKPW
jgi:probable HAF family extracellular repeat protein